VHDELVAEKDGYQAWFDEQAGSLLWKVGDDVAKRASEARREQEAVSLRAQETSAPSADALKRAQKVVLRWWWTVLPLWLLGTGAVWYVGWYRGDWELQRAIWWTIGLLVVTVVLLAAANHRFYKALRTYEARLNAQVERLRADVATYLHVGQERARLELLYGALRDWVRILGEVVHWPWQAAPPQYEDLPEEVVDALPASMGVAAQATDETAIPQSTIIEAYRLLYPRGWSSRHFDTAYEAFEDEQPTGPEEGHRSVDLDSLDSAVSPRKRLLEHWRVGAARATLTQRAIDDLHRAVRDGDLVLPQRVVERMGRYGDGTAEKEPLYFRATASESTNFATDVFSPSGQQGRVHYVESRTAWVPSSAREHARVSDVTVRDCEGPTAVRVDISRRVATSDLVVFEDVPASAPDGAHGTASVSAGGPEAGPFF